jgi:hypothetical protein
MNDGGIDLGRVLRLQAMVEAIVNASSPQSGSKPLTVTYQRVRGQVRNALPAQHQGDFEGLFPPDVAGHYDPLDDAEHDQEAPILLASLAGWLQGFVLEARTSAEIEADARAYAEARIQANKRLGFRGPVPLREIVTGAPGTCRAEW